MPAPPKSKKVSARIHSPDPFLRAESKHKNLFEKVASVLQIHVPRKMLSQNRVHCGVWRPYHTFPLEKQHTSCGGALARGMAHSSSSFFWKKVRANDIMTPPKDTSAKLEMRSDFAGAKIALSYFSKPFPPTAEAVNSKSSPQLHERTQTKIFSIRAKIH